MTSELENNFIIEISDLSSTIESNYPSVRLEKVEELKQLDPSLGILLKLVKIFQNEVSYRIPEMKNFCQCQDYENLSRHIHRFKSTTYNLGASRSAEYAKQIENAIERSASQLEVKQLINRLETECLKASERLLTFLK